MRVLLDTMIFDEIIADRVLKRDVLEIVATGGLALLTTHVQEQQIARIPDNAKREAINEIRRTVISTGAAVWDHSAWDGAKCDDGQEPVKITDIFRGNPKDIEDALIGATLSDADVLVTQDKDLRTRARTKAGDRVWSIDDFRMFVWRKTHS